MRLLRALFNFAAAKYEDAQGKSFAEDLDISAYALKRLMNHKMNGDITAGYIVADVERLRKPMQQITDYILKCMGASAPADILTIQPASKGNVHEERA